MERYLLDTNHLSPLVTTGHPLRDLILARHTDGDEFFVCVPVLIESIFGFSILPRGKSNRAEWERLKWRFPCVFIDEEDAEAAADLRVTLRAQGKQLEAMDASIAVAALLHRLTLLTKDRDFSAVPALKMENWLQ